LEVALVLNENAIIANPDRSQFNMLAALVAPGGIMYPMYGQTLDPTVIPKVNMKAMIQTMANTIEYTKS
jgi:hypothetical protein